MLRRTETVAAAKSESGPPQPARYDVEWASGSSLDRRQSTDRRQTERRGMDRLRAEALQSVIARVEDRNFNGLRDRLHWPRAIPPSRLVLIGVAVLAAGAAAFLASQYEQPTPAAAATAVMPVEQAAPTTRILVAAQSIGTGQRFTEKSLQWQDWPDTALRPDFITATADPDALARTEGAVARVDFVAGDPIVAQKLAPAGGGFLSSILASGMRAVSVTIAAEAASGGFVVPNDHVDVVLTRSANGDPATQESHIILRDVRVLAINTRLGTGPAAADAESQDPSTQAFSDRAIATLELDPTQSEVIINATTLGRLSLVLRPAADSAAASEQASDAERATNAAIRLSSPFWIK
ncbi:MAG: Flp pilus assembly protein CpaB [Devosia sp. 67-54]|uniref:Flp pilus assembly protein CpaB n=1 Tax=unclassified Devosia TaxID=196773 RepID=UPI000960978F|nr:MULTISPECIES: Flp pilus assembly protein CpaB [unclassified Devosia]MBN9303701.1 Flp pilus assembly protein CpaB [Devosia sp.]OJX17577.1 MAG: Flp pilus assembly protein CpaB [Devosia sp. 67-54]